MILTCLFGHLTTYYYYNDSKATTTIMVTRYNDNKAIELTTKTAVTELKATLPRPSSTTNYSTLSNANIQVL